jgi:hypothetical protein
MPSTVGSALHGECSPGLGLGREHSCSAKGHGPLWAEDGSEGAVTHRNLPVAAGPAKGLWERGHRNFQEEFFQKWGPKFPEGIKCNYFLFYILGIRFGRRESIAVM